MAASPAFALEAMGESGLLLRFGERIDAALNARVHAAARVLRDAALPGLEDLVPTYASLLLRFDAAAAADAARMREVERRVRAALAAAGAAAQPIAGDAPARVVEIPVCYGGDCGPDLEAVAAHAGIDASTLIARHAAGDYRVAMLGFAPGFPYLLGLDPALHAPRLATPRTRVPAGSVAIGGAQAGIYPRELPGGWRIVGRTPLVLFDAAREPPCLLAPGDRVRFRAIDAAEFARLAGAAP
ncbi:MAG: 5-oxoprolinase subunit PxpB [Mizugakiibacter sp.]|uniref:5-oxoprolinase subunit PxpB n=1 Tax=Mizugakiibacter sp. TaxID=1972610 RepID=UPI0031C2CA08|nr:5-oxoprolinase subunit PxpB [Xanthomonadaceae bacterium]